MPTRLFRILAASVVTALASAAHAVDQSMIEDCEGCHGEDGVSQWSDIPTIAGISPIVHEDALYIYRDEDRPCETVKYPTDESKPATSMCEVAKDLSDEQIQEIAAYYAEKPFVPADNETDPALVAKGEKIHEEKCAKCHTDAGGNPEDDAGILAGQQIGYLRTSFEHFAQGRPQPRKMEDALEGLSDEEVEALVHFYASQK